MGRVCDEAERKCSDWAHSESRWNDYSGVHSVAVIAKNWYGYNSDNQRGNYNVAINCIRLFFGRQYAFLLEAHYPKLYVYTHQHIKQSANKQADEAEDVLWPLLALIIDNCSQILNSAPYSSWLLRSLLLNRTLLLTFFLLNLWFTHEEENWYCEGGNQSCWYPVLLCHRKLSCRLKHTYEDDLAKDESICD